MTTRGGAIPDRMMMEVRGASKDQAQWLAEVAVIFARRLAPRLTGRSSRNFTAIYEEGMFGIQWADNYVWFQEHGISPFTMTSLAGRTIPMWVNDPDGEVARQNPRSEQRMTDDGRRQTLIFRKAAPIGSRKTVIRNGVPVDVPRSFPGAPGRISRREPPGMVRGGGRVGGQIARWNVGVRWRHPGLPRRSFIRRSLLAAVEYAGLAPGPIRDGEGRYR